MARGIGLACERCDFAAVLYEHVPFALAGSGMPTAIAPNDVRTEDGYWADGLCGICRLPVRAEHRHNVADEAPAQCTRCGSEPLSFDVAMRELADACHSRVWIDYEVEQALAQRIEAALGDMPQLRDAISCGDMTTLEALDSLAERVAAATDPERKSSQVPAPAPVPTLAGLRTLIENAQDLAAASRTLRERLRESEAHSAALRICIEDESYLPGVPCPNCEQGHLVHWPLWT